MALPLDRICGGEVETDINQLNKVEGTAVSAKHDCHTMFYNKSWAVVIGINKYEKWPELEYAVNDAKSVKKCLEKLGFDVIALMDSDATKHNILQLLGDKLPHQVQKEDKVLIFFAGHGQTEEVGGHQYGYIIPVDGELHNYYSSAISMTQVREISRRIPAKHIYYVIDACYSGLGLTRSGLRFSPFMEGYLKKVTSLRAVQMITAGGKGEQVLEVDGHGLFTKYFLSGIEGQADIDDDGVVSASELGTYLRPLVSKASEQKQTPLFGSLEGEGEFVFLLPAKNSSITTTVFEPEIRKKEEKMREWEKALRSWEELLRRQENELKKKIKNIQKVQKTRTLQNRKDNHDQYTEDKKWAQFDTLEAPLDTPVIIQLRSRPGTLSKNEIREMIEKRGFRDSVWNPEGDFPNKFKVQIIKGDKVVVDYATGLMWQQSGSSNEMSLREAVNYIDWLNDQSYAGFSDWRLPTVEELESLLKPGRKVGYFIDPIFDLKQQWFWSADKRSSGKAWSVSIRTGIITFELEDSKYYVRGVRSLR